MGEKRWDLEDERKGGQRIQPNQRPADSESV
jgi:hypothetical protein